MHEIIRILLYPISLLYGLGVWIRNVLYDKGIIKSYKAAIPVIVIGNLTVGGTGKTPHAEYLIRLLKQQFSLAYMSRGYGRKTKGLRVLDDNDTAITAGDEALQVYQKFPEISVLVSESRVKGIKTILQNNDETVVILDDAFQHRAVKPGKAILLTDYNKIFTKNFLIPTGTLREGSSGVKRADIIIVTKTPTMLSPLERRRVEAEIKLKDHQHLFFSFMKYGKLVPFTSAAEKYVTDHEFDEAADDAVLLVSGIANPEPLSYHLSKIFPELHEIVYRDHHLFKRSDIESIRRKFNGILKNKKIIITTEKDKIRFLAPEIVQHIQDLPLFYLPLEICFHDLDKEIFDQLIFNYVNKHTRINKNN